MLILSGEISKQIPLLVDIFNIYDVLEFIRLSML